jgi:hypothetical protein
MDFKILICFKFNIKSYFGVPYEDFILKNVKVFCDDKLKICSNV